MLSHNTNYKQIISILLLDTSTILSDRSHAQWFITPKDEDKKYTIFKIKLIEYHKVLTTQSYKKPVK